MLVVRAFFAWLYCVDVFSCLMYASVWFGFMLVCFSVFFFLKKETSVCLNMFIVVWCLLCACCTLVFVVYVCCVSLCCMFDCF